MKNLIISKKIVVSVVAALIFLSCHKSDENTSQMADEQTTIALSSEATNSENLYNDAFNVVTQNGEQSDLRLENSGNCAVVTLTPSDPATYPKTLLIDYGNGCTIDSITRKGKIIAVLSGKLRNAGTSISITFTNYSVNNYQLSGTYILTSNIVSGGGVNYTVTVISGSIVMPDGTSSSYSASEVFTQTAGIGTVTFSDDVYAISGTFTYTNSTSAAISGNITTPLVKSYNCKNITSGIIAFLFKNIRASLNFGTGTCDNEAILTAGLSSKTIILPR